MLKRAKHTDTEARPEPRGRGSHPRFKRIAAVAATTATAGLALALTSSAPALATAEGCTPAPFGYTCNYTHGKGTRVDRVDVIRGKADKSMICSYSAIVRVADPGGRVIYERDSGIVHNGACSPGRAYISFNVRRSFPDGSKICTRFFEGGQQQGGAPCLDIHR